MTFNNPSWLYILPIILIGLGLLLYRTSKARQRFLEAFTSSHLAERLLVAYSPVMRGIKHIFLVLGIILIVGALARPQWGFQYKEVKSKGIDVLFALDASKSMLAEDVRPNRLGRAKLAMLDFVDQLEGDRVGLIAFAGGAFLQCPPTLDYNAFKLSLDAVDTQVIAQGGTDIAAAIAEAQGSFNKDSAYKFLILITDGEDLEGAGLKRAMVAKEEGMKIYTVGVGTQEGELIPFINRQGQHDYVRDEKGNVVKSRLDERSLIRLAGATEGFYVPLGPTGEGLREIYTEALGSIPRQELNSKLQKIPLERFQLPLGIALFLLAFEPLISTRQFSFHKKRRPGIALLAIFLILFTFISNVGQASPQEAYQKYVSGDYGGAYIQYDQEANKEPDDNRLLYNKGVSAYKANQYAAAESAFRKTLKVGDISLQEKAFYNLGNTLFMQGEKGVEEQSTDAAIKYWEEALEHYQSTLDLNPDHLNAAHNKEYVEKRLEELKQQKEQQEQENEQKNQDQENQEKDQDDQQQESSDQDQASEDNQNQEPSEGQTDQGQQPQASPDSSEQGQENQSETQDSSEQSTQDSLEDQKQGENTSSSLADSEPKEEDQQSQAPERSEGMTRSEALKLLDSLKSSEKKLPINALRSQQSAHENKSKKDW